MFDAGCWVPDVLRVFPRAARLCAPCGLFAALVLQSANAQSSADLRAIDPSEATGTSMAVVVGRTPLAHTALILPVDERGKVVGLDHPTIQTEKALDNLAAALAEARTGLDRLVKVNLYVKDADVVRDVHRVFSKKFNGGLKPAVSFVESDLPLPGAYVALDAVAATGYGRGDTKVARFTSTRLPAGRSTSHVAVMPDGVKVYVSGQAEKGASLKESTAKTMESLMRTLGFLGLTNSHVVQLKAFFLPMSSAGDVEAEIAKFFPGGQAPPLTCVEWNMTTPIEIELIAYGGNQGDRAREPVEYLTPTGMTASPVYSRVTRINFGRATYISGLYGTGDSSADAQIKDIFATLQFLAGQGGSDLQHLAKATYYVSDQQASQRLNDLRPNYYDPKRPPAASKAMVRGVAQKGKTITLDMIAASRQ